jgi:uncharacterized membrane protein
MASARNFFSEGERKRIVEAIAAAEKNTSGEIRVHLENNAKPNALDKATMLFQKLGINKTELHNGVLIFLAVKDRQFAIVGDEGIHKVVPADFWDSVRNIMQEHFKKGQFADGLCAGISMTGTKLKEFFPHQDDNVNELSDEISFGDND